MENAVIIGYGVIGKAVGSAFGIKDYISLSKSTIDYKEAAKRKYVFICLPTPTIDEKCFTTDIENAVKQLVENGLTKDSVIIIRSTVYPGFNRFLQNTFGIENIVSNPEFVNNDTAKEDMQKPDLIVVGGENKTYIDMVVAIYKGRFKYIEPVVTDSITAEFIKYSLNSFFMTKVVFANTLFDAAQELKANYGTVKKILESHKWGSKNHFEIFHKGGRGAGGHCLPKDIDSFTNLIQSSFLNCVFNENENILEKYPKQ